MISNVKKINRWFFDKKVNDSKNENKKEYYKQENIDSDLLKIDYNLRFWI